MNEKLITSISGIFTGLIYTIIISVWFFTQPFNDLKMRLPGMDNVPENILNKSSSMDVKIGENFKNFDVKVINSSESWVQFRGKDSDNIVKSNIKLADKWGKDGPEVLWSHELGEGHAGAAVKNGRVYLLDYDEENKSDSLRCFVLETGKEIWRRWYKTNMKRNHGFSRTVPAITDKYVVTIGPNCHVMCVDAITGDFKWGIDLEKDYNTKTPFWYTGQCPIIYDNQAIIAPFGKVAIMGIDLSTGKKLWETPNPKSWNMSHVSIAIMKFYGKKMFVYSALEGMLAVSAHKDDMGEIMWETELWRHSVLAPTPVLMPGNRLFLTAGYGAGSMVIQINKSNGKYSAKKLQEFKPKHGLASEQQTPIVHNGYIFGIMPKDSGALRKQFVCYHPDDCTKLVWSSGVSNRFGLGPYILADKKFFILNDDGVLTMIKASTTGYEQLDQAKVVEGHDAWAPIALAGTKLILRSSKNIVCLNIGK